MTTGVKTKIAAAVFAGALFMSCEQTGTGAGETVSSPLFEQAVQETHYSLSVVEGLKQFKEHQYSRLAQSEAESFTINLEAGKDYVITALCDLSCYDVDLHLKKDGEILASDTLEDDFPIINYSATETGRYEIIGDMIYCDAPACSYAILFYETR